MNVIVDAWQSIPPLTRLMLVFQIGLSCAVWLELVSPFKLYFNWSLIAGKHQYWRLLTSLFYKGDLSPHLIFDFLMFIRYSSMLENHHFRNKPAEYIVFVAFGSVCFWLAAYFLGMQFMAYCVTTMMVYLQARIMPDIPMSILNLFHFRSCWLPFVYFLVIVLWGSDPTYDLVGNVVAHTYFYLVEILPQIPELQDFRILSPPKWLVDLCS